MTIHNIKNRPVSLSLRVTAFVGVTTTLCLIILGYIVQQSIAMHFAELDAEELQVVADSVRNSLIDSYTGQAGPEFHDLLESAVSGHHGVYFMVVDPTGANRYSMPGPDLSAIIVSAGVVEEVNSNTLYSWVDNEQTFRGAVLNMNIVLPNSTPEISQQFTVAVAATMDFHMSFMESFNTTLWSIVAGASLITVLAAWFAVHQGHAPLRFVSNKISNISSDKLDLRLDDGQVPVELVDLVTSFNDMMGRVEGDFNRLSNFSADIAHELRTPLTNITTQTEVGLSKARDINEYREILYSNLEEYKRLTKMINDVLTLAKSESGLLKPLFEDLDLSVEIRELFDYFEAWSDEKGVSLTLNGGCQMVRGDREMIKGALNNLLSNAIRNTAPNQTVKVTLSTIGENSLILVENPGPEIPAEYLPRVFDRFYRIDPSRQGEGAGLGLAIAKSIIEIHNGKISVVSENGITIFSVQLPSALV